MTTIRTTAEPRRHRQSALAAAVVVLAVAGISSASFWIAASEPTAAAPAAGAPAVPVQIATPSIQEVPVQLDGLGTVQASNTVNITTRVDGELQNVLFTEGQAVKKGDLLAIIDARPYQAAADQAAAKIKQDQADLANAQYLLAKDQKLSQQQIATQETVEQQQSQVASFTAQLAEDQAAKEAADVSLSYTGIRSPIDGRTGIRRVDAGNQIHTTDTTPIVTITQTQPISVVSTLREDDLSAVRDAMKSGPVEVTALSMDQSKTLATGTLSLIDNVIDQNSGTIRIKSTFENQDDALWPGQFVVLRVKQKTLHQAMTIPSSALQRGADGFFVYVVDGNGNAAIRKVTPGPTENGRAVITRGLSGNEQVVAAGQYRLDEGTHVSVQPAEGEWAFMLYGSARITAVDAAGKNFVDDVGPGDLWYFPSGTPHSIQGLGPHGCEFLLVFDDGGFDEDSTFLLTDWFNHVPLRCLPKTSRRRSRLSENSRRKANGTSSPSPCRRRT